MPANPNAETINAIVENMVMNVGISGNNQTPYHDIGLLNVDNNTRQSYRYFGAPEDVQVARQGETWQVAVTQKGDYFNLTKFVQKLDANGVSNGVAAEAPAPSPATGAAPRSRPTAQRSPQNGPTIDLRERATNARTALMQAVAFVNGRLAADPVLASTAQEEALTSADVTIITRMWANELNNITEGYDGSEE